MYRIGYRLYLLLAAGAMVAISIIFLGVAAWLEPLTGDLTRLGGYAERDFGWNGEQARFSPPLAAAGSLRHAVDVAVVGDSFSIPVEADPTAAPGQNDKTHWTDFFAARTGLTVESFHRDRVDLETYLASDAFQRTPPKLLVLEYAERTLQWAPVDGSARCAVPAPSRSAAPAVHPTSRRPVGYRRDRSHGIDNARIDGAIDYISKNVPRLLAGVNITHVSRHPLSKRGMFTNDRSDQLLVFSDDFAKARLSDGFLRSLSCYFAEVQRRVEANGRTKFVLMVAPDRTTAYAEYLPDVHLPNLTEVLARTDNLNMLRLDRDLKRAIDSGVQDVYLPSDTHWGSAGMAIAADALIAFLALSPDR